MEKNAYIYDRNVEGSLALTFAERSTMIRCMNSVIFQIHSIEKIIAQLSHIGLDRLSTHCLESFFENVINRNVINHCKNFDSYDNLLSNAAHSIISSNFLYNVRMISLNKKSLTDGSSLFYLSLEEHRVHISTYFHPAEFAGILYNYVVIPFSNCVEHGKIFIKDELDVALNIKLFFGVVRYPRDIAMYFL